jgi:hypothetical protein
VIWISVDPFPIYETDRYRGSRSQIDVKGLRHVFQDFATLYGDAPPETKRKMLNVIIEEISFSRETREKQEKSPTN